MKKNEIVKTPAAQDTPYIVAMMQIIIDDILNRVAALELRVIQLMKEIDHNARQY